MIHRGLVCAVCAAMTLSGCAAALVQFASGAAGGYIGTQMGKGEGGMITGLGGAIVGSMSDEKVKKVLSHESDRVRAATAYNNAFVYAPGTVYRTDWRTNSGDHFDLEIAPRSAYVAGELYCNEYAERIWINGTLAGGKAFGKGCRNNKDPDATWHLQ